MLFRYLKQLENPVEVTAFFKENRGNDFDALVRRVRVDEALRATKAARSSKFFYAFKDPDLEPDLVRKLFCDTPTPFVNETIILADLTTGRAHRAQERRRVELRFNSVITLDGQEPETFLRENVPFHELVSRAV